MAIINTSRKMLFCTFMIYTNTLQYTGMFQVCYILLQPSIEMLWAMKAYEHAEVYFNVSFVKNLELLEFVKKC